MICLRETNFWRRHYLIFNPRPFEVCCLLLTHDVQVSKLSFGSDGVDLAHVPAFIFLLHVADVKEPRTVLVVCDRDAWVTRDHVVVNRQDGGLLEVHPRNLKKNTIPVSDKNT